MEWRSDTCIWDRAYFCSFRLLSGTVEGLGTIRISKKVLESLQFLSAVPLSEVFPPLRGTSVVVLA